MLTTLTPLLMICLACSVIGFALSCFFAIITAIGLTIPAVGAVAISLGMTLDLGLPAKEIVLLALTLIVSAITVIGGQATIMQGTVHLVLFAVFLFLAIFP